MPLQHVYACLVHERLDCVVDLVRNLRRLDPSSAIVLYNGGRDPHLLKPDALAGFDPLVHPSPRPMVWGRLHDFALDCMELALESVPFELLTIVDSDQLLLRPGYVEFLARTVELDGLGLLSSCAGWHGPSTRQPTVRSAWRDFPRWQSWLAGFPNRKQCFAHWTFWPATVFTRQAAERVLHRVRYDRVLASTLARCRMSVTEEILFPTLVALLGLRVDQNPTCQSWVRYRQPSSVADCEAALSTADAFFMHPVPRRFDDPARSRIRAEHGY